MSKLRRLVSILVASFLPFVPLEARADAYTDCQAAYAAKQYAQTIKVCSRAVNEIAYGVSSEQQKVTADQWTHATWTAFVSMLQAETYQGFAAVKMGGKLKGRGAATLFGITQLLEQVEEVSPFDDISQRIAKLQQDIQDFANVNLSDN
jgi:hypothetical protein